MKKCKIKKFTKQEKIELFRQVTTNLKNGISVRHTCYDLAGGDAKLMLRLQNKYRNMKKLEAKNMQDDTKKVINIAAIKNKNNRVLTDSDINSLFLGLVKLIKKTTMQNINESLKKDCVQANENFRQSLIDLTNTQNLLKKEQQKNLELTVLIEEQKAKICLLLKKLKLESGNVF